MENHTRKTLQFDENFLKLEYTSEINISFCLKRNSPKKKLIIRNITFK